MAIFLNDDAPISRLMAGDLGANSFFYHKLCSTKLYNNYMKNGNKHCKKEIDIDQAKEAVWNKVIACMTALLSQKQKLDLRYMMLKVCI